MSSNRTQDNRSQGHTEGSCSRHDCVSGNRRETEGRVRRDRDQRCTLGSIVCRNVLSWTQRPSWTRVVALCSDVLLTSSRQAEIRGLTEEGGHGWRLTFGCLLREGWNWSYWGEGPCQERSAGREGGWGKCRC